MLCRRALTNAIRPMVQKRCPPIRFCAAGTGATAKPPVDPPKAQDDPNAPTPVLPLSVVEKPFVKKILPIVGNVGYLTLAGGMLMTDVLALRCLLATGYGSLVGYHAFQLRPLRIPLMGSVFFVCVNLYFAIKIFLDRQVNLTEEEAAIHNDFFHPEMMDNEFEHIIRMGNITTAKEPTQLTFAGKMHENLVFVVDGYVEVIIPGKNKKGECHVQVHKDEFVGEGSFIGKVHVARANAFAMPGCKYVSWNLEALKQKLKSEPHAQRALEVKIGRELAHKLHDTTDLLARANAANQAKN